MDFIAKWADSIRRKDGDEMISESSLGFRFTQNPNAIKDDTDRKFFEYFTNEIENEDFGTIQYDTETNSFQVILDEEYDMTVRDAIEDICLGFNEKNGSGYGIYTSDQDSGKIGFVGVADGYAG